MNAEQMRGLDPRAQSALLQLQDLIRGRFPTASFEVSRSEDDAENIHLFTTVDVEDPDDVLDVVIDRVLEMQTEESLPVHVIPVRTPDRVLQLLQAQRSELEQSLRRP